MTDYVRDARGLVTKKTDARSVVVDMTYDDAGRLLTKTFPASIAENVAYTYDSIAGGNVGKGRLTSMTHEGGSIALTYDARGNVLADARVITSTGTTPHTVTYSYDAADQLTGITYPSGREVAYTRDSIGRISSVKTRKTSADPWSDAATSIVYQPLSRLVQSFDFGNGLNYWHTYTQDYELDVLGLYDGATDVINKAHTRTDDLNLTNIWDNVDSTKNKSFWYNPANRLQNADGPWGDKTFYYDGVGNRTYENTTIGGTTTSDQCTYNSTSNLMQSIVRDGSTTIRTFTYDAAGNTLTDVRSGSTYTYTYNHANRLKTVTYEGNLKGTYTYNAREQLITRVVTNSGAANGTTHFIHDLMGNVIAELNSSGAAVREYIYLPEAEIAPTRQSRTTVDMPVAVIEDASGTSPTTYSVHVDHLHRPIKMTNSAKASVWDAVWTPWGAPHSITGSATMDARFPGQWFQLEAGLHYNWHRHYDPSIGRYTQPDPLGFVDGPSVYAYAMNSPQIYVDKDGLNATTGGTIGQVLGAITPIPGGAAAGRILGTLAGAAIAYQCKKSVTCTAQCNVQRIDPKANCPDRVKGGPVSSKSEVIACVKAKREATQSSPRGCYPRHCKCKCR